MQQCTLFVLALVVAPVIASSASVESAVSAWLHMHRSPTDDQLGELKKANPAAYAMVKALLTKQSMGLVKLTPSEKGPDVFRRMMSPSHTAAAEQSVDLPYAEAEAQPIIHDQMHYDPKAAADKDESMVSSLLSTVAGMAGSKGKRIALLKRRRQKDDIDNPLLQDAAALGEDTKTTPALAQAVENQEAAQQAAAAPNKENSYLKGLDLSGDMPVSMSAVEHPALEHNNAFRDTSRSDLASFSFDGAALAKQAPLRPQKTEVPQPKKDNSFLNWLGMVKKASAPEDGTAPAKNGNPYIADLLN